MKIGSIELNRTPAVAGVITGPVTRKILARAKREGADLIELRLDTLKDRDPGKLKEALGKRPRGVPILLTIRDKKEGGRFHLSDGERMSLFTELIPSVDAVDIELSSKKILADAFKAARRSGKTVIVSYHNFKTTPGKKRLAGIIRDARGKGADIVKVATLAKNKGDLLRLLNILAGNKNMIVVAMGRYGRVSRVILPFLGSLITYGALTEKTAPGQFGLKELKNIFSELGV
ncbi:MAG: type I 3-dehydroquinate dehydratase [Deltaproteobacteria bacterium]|nr:type I 3-dehydroquinate dehydratase [Deltaproteobacteria bacterium]